ncbi:hypothetical protein [Cysteiniphilum litorale]|uniref:hypothetical protein n=1 Tax=Cysteiniphilum litorale TaxID=2056700 RepID=UPI003F885D5C
MRKSTKVVKATKLTLLISALAGFAFLASKPALASQYLDNALDNYYNTQLVSKDYTKELSKEIKAQFEKQSLKVPTTGVVQSLAFQKDYTKTPSINDFYEALAFAGGEIVVYHVKDGKLDKQSFSLFNQARNGMKNKLITALGYSEGNLYIAYANKSVHKRNVKPLNFIVDSDNMLTYQSTKGSSEIGFVHLFNNQDAQYETIYTSPKGVEIYSFEPFSRVVGDCSSQKDCQIKPYMSFTYARYANPVFNLGVGIYMV